MTDDDDDVRERCPYCGVLAYEPCDEPPVDVCPQINELFPLQL